MRHHGSIVPAHRHSTSHRGDPRREPDDGRVLRVVLASEPRPGVREQPRAAYQKDDRGTREEPRFRAVEHNDGDDEDDDAQDGNDHPERSFGARGHEEPIMVSHPSARWQHSNPTGAARSPGARSAAGIYRRARSACWSTTAKPCRRAQPRHRPATLPSAPTRPDLGAWITWTSVTWPAGQLLPMWPARILVTMTEVMVTVENPATIILGRISCSMAATSSGDSPAPRAASWERIMVPGKP